MFTLRLPGVDKYQAICGLALVMIVPMCLGCSDDEQIRIYKVAKSDSQAVASLPGMGAGSPAELSEQQMLAAIVPNEDAAWFFKLTGTPEAVGKRGGEFRSIVDSVRFETSGPKWELAEGWTEQFSQGMAYAKLSNKEDGLTATITRLETLAVSDIASWQEYVASNVNRWRDQLSLPPQDWDKLASDLEEVDELSQGPAKAYFVSLVGKGAGGMSGGPMRGPFQDALTSESAPGEAEIGPTPEMGLTPEARSELKFETPTGWEPLDVSGSSMRLLAFKVADGDSQAELTVIDAGGEIQAVMGMWYGQIEMEPLPEALDKSIEGASEVEVNGVSSKVYFLDGTETDAKLSILAAEIPWGQGNPLYVKLRGDAELVASERENFTEFLNGLSW